jgi:hypothetical protein
MGKEGKENTIPSGEVDAAAGGEGAAFESPWPGEGGGCGDVDAIPR